MKAKETFNAIGLMAEKNAREGKLIPKTLEELGELADALKTKATPCGDPSDRFVFDRGSREELVGEMADVRIMLDQLAARFGLWGELGSMIEYKICRTMHESALEAKKELAKNASDED